MPTAKTVVDIQRYFKYLCDSNAITNNDIFCRINIENDHYTHKFMSPDMAKILGSKTSMGDNHHPSIALIRVTDSISMDGIYHIHGNSIFVITSLNILSNSVVRYYVNEQSKEERWVFPLIDGRRSYLVIKMLEDKLFYYSLLFMHPSNTFARYEENWNTKFVREVPKAGLTTGFARFLVNPIVIINN